MRMIGRVRKYVQELVEDGLHAGASFVIAWFLLGAALWYNVDLNAVLDFNLWLIKTATSWFPVAVASRLQFALRLWGEYVLFFGELWFLAAAVIRVLGLCLALIYYAARWLHRRSRNRNC